jgi:hypothetical protein
VSGRRTSHPTRLLASLAAVATAALVSACGAGAHGPQYKERATIEGIDADLPNGLVIGNAYVAAPATRGQTANVIFTVSVLRGSGGTITAVRSPIADQVVLQSVDPSGHLTTQAAASVAADGSQTPHVYVARLKGLSVDLPPASFTDVTFAVAGEADTTLSLPVIRPGQLALGPGGIPVAVLDRPSGTVSADTSESNPGSDESPSATP